MRTLGLINWTGREWLYFGAFFMALAMIAWTSWEEGRPADLIRAVILAGLAIHVAVAFARCYLEPMVDDQFEMLERQAKVVDRKYPKPDGPATYPCPLCCRDTRVQITRIATKPRVVSLLLVCRDCPAEDAVSAKLLARYSARAV